MASFQQLLKDKGKTLNISEMVIPKIQMIHYKKLHGSQKNFYSKERIEELADAIEIAGMILQPLIVCKTDMGEYDVLAGHRRLAADTYNVEEKGLKKFEQVPCIEIVAGEVIKEMIENNKEKAMTAEEAMDVFAEFVIGTGTMAKGIVKAFAAKMPVVMKSRTQASLDKAMLERDERRREQAEILAQSAAEAYSVSGNAEWAVRQALGCEAAFADGRCELSLDEGLSPAEDGEITLVLTEKRSEPAVVGCYSELSMVFMKRGEEFYSLDCGAYIPKKGEAAHFD